MTQQSFVGLEQLKQYTSLSEIASGGDVQLNQLISNINDIVKEPGSLSFPGGNAILTVSPTSVTVGPGGKIKTLPQISGIDVGSVSGTFNFSGSPSVTVTGDAMAITNISLTAGQFVKVGLEVRTDAKIYAVFGTPGASQAAALAPVFSKKAVALGYIVLVNNGTPGVGNITARTNANIFSFGSGSGGASSGTGSINYVKNPDADAGTNDVTAAGTVTLTQTASAGELLRGTNSFKLSKNATASVSGDYAQWAMDDMALADLNAQYTYISFDFKNLTVGNAEGDWEVYLVDTDNSNALLTPSVYKVPAGSGTFQAVLPVVAADNTYALRILNKIVSRDLVVDNVSVGPNPLFINSVSPLVYSDEDHTVGSVGAAPTTQGGLTDTDFPSTTNLVYWTLVGDALHKNTAGVTHDLTQNGTPSFTERGFFGRTTLAKFVSQNSTYLNNTNAFFNPAPSGGFSLGGWFFIPNAPTTDPRIITNVGTTQGGYEFGIDTGALFFQTYNSGGAAVNVITTPVTNFSPGWHHFVFVVASASTNRMYVDGKLYGTGTGGTSVAGNTTNFKVGGPGTGTKYFNGVMQDLFFASGQVFTEAQVNTLYSKRFRNAQIAAGHILDSNSFPVINSDVTWWNLASAVTDGSGNARSLTNNGTVTFTGANIFGTASSAALLNGTTQWFNSTSAFFNTGNTDFFVGGWIKPNDYNSGSGQMVFSQWSSNSNRGWFFDLDSGNINVVVGNAAGNNDATIISTPIPDKTAAWNHVGIRYTAASLKWEVFWNGVSIAQAIAANAINTTSSDFAIGAYRSGAAAFFAGVIQDVNFVKMRLTDEEVAKFSSSRIDLNASASSIAYNNAIWRATYKSDTQVTSQDLPNTWIIDKKVTGKLYVNFGLTSDAVVSMYLYDGGSVAKTIPLRTFQQTFTSAPTTVAHGLPGMPAAVSLQQDELADGKYTQLDSSSFVKADATNLYFSGLPTIDSTHPLRVTASMPATVASIQVATTSTPGTLSADAQSISGLKTFLGGESSVEYVGTNPEVGGSSPFQLTRAHKRTQVINPAGAITTRLPADLFAGESVTIQNRSANLTTIQSSATNAVSTLINGASQTYVALVNNPTLSSDWNIVSTSDPISLNDVNATLEGKKPYFDGTTYNGGIAPTVTISGVAFSGKRCVFIPYKMQDGSWRMKVDMSLSPSTGTSIPGAGFTVNIVGVTFKTTTGVNPMYASADTINNIVNWSYATGGTGNIIIHFSSSTNYNATDFLISGDVALDSKPTWAY